MVLIQTHFWLVWGFFRSGVCVCVCVREREREWGGGTFFILQGVWISKRMLFGLFFGGGGGRLHSALPKEGLNYIIHTHAKTKQKQTTTKSENPHPIHTHTKKNPTFLCKICWKRRSHTHTHTHTCARARALKERERERESVCVCVCVCAHARARVFVNPWFGSRASKLGRNRSFQWNFHTENTFKGYVFSNLWSGMAVNDHDGEDDDGENKKIIRQNSDKNDNLITTLFY